MGEVVEERNWAALVAACATGGWHDAGAGSAPPMALLADAVGKIQETSDAISLLVEINRTLGAMDYGPGDRPAVCCCSDALIRMSRASFWRGSALRPARQAIAVTTQGAINEFSKQLASWGEADRLQLRNPKLACLVQLHIIRAISDDTYALNSLGWNSGVPSAWPVEFLDLIEFTGHADLFVRWLLCFTSLGWLTELDVSHRFPAWYKLLSEDVFADNVPVAAEHNGQFGRKFAILVIEAAILTSRRAFELGLAANGLTVANALLHAREIFLERSVVNSDLSSCIQGRETADLINLPGRELRKHLIDARELVFAWTKTITPGKASVDPLSSMADFCTPQKLIVSDGPSVSAMREFLFRRNSSDQSPT
jgi:hypothetical protein